MMSITKFGDLGITLHLDCCQGSLFLFHHPLKHPKCPIVSRVPPRPKGPLSQKERASIRLGTLSCLTRTWETPSNALTNNTLPFHPVPQPLSSRKRAHTVMDAGDDPFFVSLQGHPGPVEQVTCKRLLSSSMVVVSMVNTCGYHHHQAAVDNSVVRLKHLPA